MGSVSIQARIDGAQWKTIERKGETKTETLQRITAHYLATSGDDLSAIAPTPDAAIAVLLHSHNLLSAIAGNAAIALPQVATAPPSSEPTAQHVSATAPAAAQSADDW